MQEEPRRFRICTFVLTGLLIVLIGRLFYIQIIRHKHYLAMALEQQEDVVMLEPERGIIYSRNGSPMTINVEANSVYANPREIRDKIGTARRLSGILGADSGKLLGEFSKRNRSFAWVKRKISEEEKKKVEELDIKGIYFLNEPNRVYPGKEMASHILGFVGIDNRGLEGVEKSYDKFLKGTPVKAVIQKDGTGRNVFFRGGNQAEAEKGCDITLTIDEFIQHVSHEALSAAVRKSGAHAAAIIVMDPRTGEVLALADEPSFDPNNFQKYKPESWRNRAITDMFEPGSTFKIVTACAALEEGIARTGDRVNCENGTFKFEDRTIRDVHKYKILTFSEVVEYSSNIGITKIGMKIGRDKLYSYIRAFGFGEPTGMGLDGELSGLLRAPNRWSAVSIAAIPYGQEVSVTPIQMITAVSAIANGGMLMKPQIVKSIKDAGGRLVYEFKPAQVRQVVSQKTCDEITGMLEKAVENGTGTEARINGYRVAGKTGTAQKIDRITRAYHPDNFVSSFVGYFPAENPRVAIYVLVDEPKREHYGGVVAGPVFRKVAQQLISYLGIQPEGRVSIGSVLNDSETAGVLRARAREPEPRIFSSGKMPDLKGMTLRAAVETMKRYTVKLEIRGSGKAVSQQPQPGAELGVGETVTVVFRHSQDAQVRESIEKREDESKSKVKSQNVKGKSEKQNVKSKTKNLKNAHF